MLCVCVSSQFILDVKFVGSTSRGHTGFLIYLPSAVLVLVFLARTIQPFLSLVDREVEFLCTKIPVFMVTKSCTKILIFPSRFSCQHFAVEDFVKLFMGKKSCRWEKFMFGHGFNKLV